MAKIWLVRRGYWLIAVLLAVLFVLPLGNARGLALLVALIFVAAVCYASRRDLIERGAPVWAWLSVWAVSLLLTPLGGFVLWMLLRARWRRPVQRADHGPERPNDRAPTTQPASAEPVEDIIAVRRRDREHTERE